MSTAADEVWAILREVAQSQKETDRRFQETDKKFQETDKKFQELAQSQQETDRRFQETDMKSREADRKLKQQLKELGQQIGGLGDKFGYFTEGMALPSMERILTDHFGMTSVMPRARTRKGGETMEIDVLAYANGELNTAVVVEVKSRVKREAIEQLRGMAEHFRDFYPEHASKRIIAILAGVDWDAGVAEEARDTGFLTASIHDEIFELTTSEAFHPKEW